MSLPVGAKTKVAPISTGRDPLRSVPSVDNRLGILGALLIFCVYGGWALSVEFSQVAYGFHSDESTYYMMGHSIASDGDLTYRVEDLMRVWREFPSGPFGVFLKKGRDVEGVGFMSKPPFFEIHSRPDSDTTRLFYGKSFIYPLVAAPFVAIFGTSGFLVLHAVLMALVMLSAYLFISARSDPLVAFLLASGFVMASVVPVYFVWITPELFNFSFVVFGIFCWVYKKVASRDSVPYVGRWLFTPMSDLIAVAFLAIATFSKPTNVLLILPLLVDYAWHRQWRRVLSCGFLFGIVVASFFAINIAITGEWNYQGGERRTFYEAYPFQTKDASFDRVGMDRATDRVLTEEIFDREVFWTVFGHNLGYFVVGRYSGLLPYFFPAVFAVGMFLIAYRRRVGWQGLIACVAAAEILFLIVLIPYNYFGGGGVIGNRYFMSVYGVFLFLLPPVQRLWIAIIPWIVGSLFTAQITLNPFFSSFHPAEHAKSGLLRMLPVELSLVNDLPVNTNPSRVKVPFGKELPFQLYFLDNNAYSREEEAFWVKGNSKAEFLVKSASPASRFIATLRSGARPNFVKIQAGNESKEIDMEPGSVYEVVLSLDDGFPYRGTRIWVVSVESSGGFVPMFTSGGGDNRFLGVSVSPELGR